MIGRRENGGEGRVSDREKLVVEERARWCREREGGGTVTRARGESIRQGEL